MAIQKKLEKIWQDFNESLLKYINSKVSSTEEAEDILQNVFIKIYKNINSLNDEKKVKSWVYTITRNTIYDYYKQNNSKIVEFDDSLMNIANENDDQYLSEISSCIFTMIWSLPQKYAEALLRVDVEWLSQKELAKNLNISIPWAKSRVQRGRKILKEIFLWCCELEINKYGKITDINQSKKCDQC